MCWQRKRKILNGHPATLVQHWALRTSHVSHEYAEFLKLSQVNEVNLTFHSHSRWNWAEPRLIASADSRWRYLTCAAHTCASCSPTRTKFHWLILAERQAALPNLAPRKTLTWPACPHQPSSEILYQTLAVTSETSASDEDTVDNYDELCLRRVACRLQQGEAWLQQKLQKTFEFSVILQTKLKRPHRASHNDGTIIVGV